MVTVNKIGSALKQDLATYKPVGSASKPESPYKSESMPICPRCGSNEVIKKGSRLREVGEAQRYQCKDCEYKFTPDLVRQTFVGHKFHQTGKTLVAIDEKRVAKLPGKRVTAWGTTYYEYRRNRSDVNPKKRL
jgi:predicted RNA-binding Zn-ribbon protein involved in translation (DUF1610 family)